jgi:hypothetical protein
MVFVIKAELRDLRTKTFKFTAQKTMYGGKNIVKGDAVFIFASENEGGRGLIAPRRSLWGRIDREESGRCPPNTPRQRHREMHRGRKAAQHSMKSCRWARAYYDQLRAIGKRHHAALRALAFKRQRILFRC